MGGSRITGQKDRSDYVWVTPDDIFLKLDSIESCHSNTPQGIRCCMNRIHPSLRPLSTLLLAVLVLQGCNALNPLCGSARPSPSISNLSATSIPFAQVQGFLLTVNGSHIVASSVVVINGTTLSTQVVSSSQLQVTLTTALLTGPGTASVTIKTPSGNSADLGCTSGGTSQALTLTIT